VAEHLGYDLRVHVLLEQQGGGRVAQIVEPKSLDPGALEQRPERPAPQVRRIHAPADLVREHQTAVVPSVTGGLALLALVQPYCIWLVNWFRSK